MKPVDRDSPNDGEGLTWDDGKPLTKREGQAWWAGWEEGHSDGCAGMHDEMRFEIEQLRDALRYMVENPEDCESFHRIASVALRGGWDD